MNIKIFSQINIIHKQTYSIKSALRRKLITNDYACLIYSDASKIPEQTIKNIGKKLLVFDLVEYILKYHLEEPKFICM